MNTIYFDIETAPLPEAELLATMPPFDPAEVKLGNIKDEAKIAAKLDEAKEKHKRDYLEKAALDPMTGQVLAIGIAFNDNSLTVFSSDAEKELLADFWKSVTDKYGSLFATLCGFNICAFDLPFLIKRSWKHGIRVPNGLRRGKWWSDNVIDLREAWTMGDRYAHGSLDTVAKHLGLAGKIGSGKDFAALWQSDRAAAIDYLKQDVRLCQQIAKIIL